MKKPLSLITATLATLSLDNARAVELEPKGKALQNVLGSTKVATKKLDGLEVFYTKNAAGKAEKLAFVVKNTWQKTCSHTWVVGIHAKDGKVYKMRAQDQQCPHAKPTAAESYLENYYGKGPADVAKLSDQVDTIAKATGSCELATEAVKTAITTYQKNKGKL